MGIRVQQHSEPSSRTESRPRRPGAHRRGERGSAAQAEVIYLQGPPPPRPGPPSENTIPLPVIAAAPPTRAAATSAARPQRRVAIGVGLSSAAVLGGLFGFGLASTVGGDAQPQPQPQAQPVQPKVAGPPVKPKAPAPKETVRKPAVVVDNDPEPVVRHDEPVVAERVASSPRATPVRHKPRPATKKPVDKVWRVSGDLSDSPASDYASMKRQAADYVAQWQKLARKYKDMYDSYN